MTQDPIFLTQEGHRLLAARHDPAWHRRGPYYGDDFRVPYPAGSDEMLPLDAIADRLSQSLGRLFLRDADGRRAVWETQRYSRTTRDFTTICFWTACIALLARGSRRTLAAALARRCLLTG